MMNAALVLAQVNDGDDDFSSLVWIIVGVLLVIALAIWILRNIR
jgi:hypothetical protein